MNHLKQIIYTTIQNVVNEQSPGAEAIQEQDALVEDLGLKSLDLARIIATLELKLDLDPFAELVSITSIRTVGDLYAAYLLCYSTQQADAVVALPTAEPATEQSDPRARQRELRRQAVQGA